MKEKNMELKKKVKQKYIFFTTFLLLFWGKICILCQLFPSNKVKKIIKKYIKKKIRRRRRRRKEEDRIENC